MDKNEELSNKFNDLINHLMENSEEIELLKNFKITYVTKDSIQSFHLFVTL